MAERVLPELPNTVVLLEESDAASRISVKFEYCEGYDLTSRHSLTLAFMTKWFKEI